MRENNPENPVFTSKRMEQQHTRMQGVKMVNSGHSVAYVANFFNVSARAVYKWMEKFSTLGEKGLLASKDAGRPPKVTQEQGAWIASTVKDDNPSHWGFETKLWTLPHIKKVIERGLKLTVCLPTLGKLMKQMGFTPQRPLRRAWEQDAALVEHWLQVDLPALRQKAQAEGARLLFADEASMRTDYHAGTTWAVRGKTPIVSSTGKRESVNMISAVSTTGDLQFMLIDGPGTSHVFKEFLEKLVFDSRRPIMLVVDNHSTHRSKIVMDYVRTTNGKLELHYIPPYSPQLNPDDQVWKNIKGHVAKKCPADKYEMRGMLRKALERLREAPEIVRGFFRHPECGFVNQIS